MGVILSRALRGSDNAEVCNHHVLESGNQECITEVPELPGCAADGSTDQQALANMEVAIQEWLETAQELGQPIPETKGRLVCA